MAILSGWECRIRASSWACELQSRLNPYNAVADADAGILTDSRLVKHVDGMQNFL